jgi:hypothetical protein
VYKNSDNNLTITSVIDEVAYNNDDIVCNIQSSKIVNGSNLMNSVETLETW